MMNLNDINKKAKIDFPCEWSYKVIGADKKLLELAIEEVLSNYPFKIVKITPSSKGNYTSLTIKLTVLNHDEIETHFKRLSDHEHVKIVL